MNKNVTYKEYSDYVSEATADGNTFLSQTLGEIKKGAIAESQRLGVTADALARDYQRFSDKAAGLAERAANAGNPRQAQFWNSHATAFGNAAAERAGMSAEAYVAKAAQDAKAAASNLGVKGGALVDAAFMVAAALEGFSTGDFSSLGRTSTSVLFSTYFGAAAAGVLATLGMPVIVTGVLVGLVAWGASWLGASLWDSLYNSAKSWQPPRDPIILDLDGNGLQTVGLTSNIYFDHNGDGILSKTGWVGEGDALLVWDRNANGLIDNGAELFGDFTPLPDGTLAPNGFAALAALDANGDGILDASDPAFAELKLWIDSDQNGVTGEGELMSLADAGIASLNLGSTLKNQKQSNGNTLAREGSFTRTDGTESAMGEFHLAIDTFDTRFAEQIEVPEELRGLPMMNGSGNVRDLQQAATQSSSLQSLLGQFENSTDRFEQKALVDQILTRWANTSGMADSLDSRAKGEFRIEYEAFGNVRRSAHIVSSGAGAAGPSNTVGSGASLASDSGNQNLTAEYRALMSEWSNKLHVLEAFNGQYFFNLPDKKSLTPSANHGFSVVQPSSKPGTGVMAAEEKPLYNNSIQYAA